MSHSGTMKSENKTAAFHDSTTLEDAGPVLLKDHTARVFLAHLDMYSANFGQTLAIAESLSADGWDAQIICRASCRLAQAARDKAVPICLLPDKGEKSLSMVWKLLRLFRDRKSSLRKGALVHACDPAASQLLSLVWRLNKKLRLVHTRRMPIMEANPKAIRCYQTPPAKVVTDSLAGKIALRLSGLETHLLYTIACGLNPDSALPRAPRDDGRFAFAVTGDLVPLCGHPHFFDALTHLTATNGMPPWEARVLGDGPLFTELLDDAVQKDVASRVAFLCGQNNAFELSRCDALVLPAAEGESRQPLILQGWATGVPVITINRLDHAEILQHETNCLLAQPGDAAELAAHMARLACDPELWKRLVQGGRASLKEFNADRMVAEHSRLYRETLA